MTRLQLRNAGRAAAVPQRDRHEDLTTNQSRPMAYRLDRHPTARLSIEISLGGRNRDVAPHFRRPKNLDTRQSADLVGKCRCFQPERRRRSYAVVHHVADDVTLSPIAFPFVCAQEKDHVPRRVAILFRDLVQRHRITGPDILMDAF